MSDIEYSVIMSDVIKSFDCTFVKTEDPDEMQHNAAFHQGLHFFAEVKSFFKNLNKSLLNK